MAGILLDIEGTTTPISFVYDVLFPFARRHLATYLPHADVSDLRSEYQEDVRCGQTPPAWSSPPIQYVEWLMDQDRKSTALKKIQGEIWLEGYQKAELHGEVFQDVPAALKRWRSKDIDVRIFSSGSILAQHLLFSSTKDGDLTRFLSGFYDTTTGPKNDSRSYTEIARSFGLTPLDILFISDVTRELDAARAAGMKTLLCIRPGNHPPPPHDHETITSFEGL
jgi:enolase-phosphatase E1